MAPERAGRTDREGWRQRRPGGGGRETAEARRPARRRRANAADARQPEGQAVRRRAGEPEPRPAAATGRGLLLCRAFSRKIPVSPAPFAYTGVRRVPKGRRDPPAKVSSGNEKVSRRGMGNRVGPL